MLTFRIGDLACICDKDSIEIRNYKPDKNIIVSKNSIISDEKFAFIKYNSLFRTSYTGVIVLPKCTRLCKYCSNKFMIDNSDDLEYMDWLLDIITTEDFEHFIITGGEPFDNYDNLLTILHKIKNKRVIIYTSAFKKINNIFSILHKFDNVIIDYTIDNSKIHPVDKLIELGNIFKERFLLKHSIIDPRFVYTFTNIQLNGNGFGYTVSYVLEPINEQFDDKYKSFLLNQSNKNFNAINSDIFIINKTLIYYNVNRNPDIYNILTNSHSTSYNYSKFLICKTQEVIDGCDYNHCFSTNCKKTIMKNECNYLIDKCIDCPIYKTCCILYSSIEHYKKNELCTTMINAELINRWLYLNKRYSELL